MRFYCISPDEKKCPFLLSPPRSRHQPGHPAFDVLRVLAVLVRSDPGSALRQILQEKHRAAADSIAGRSNRQEIVLAEAAARIRRYTGMALTAKHDRPMAMLDPNGLRRRQQPSLRRGRMRSPF